MTDNLAQTALETAESIQQLLPDAIYKVATWSDRVYLNLRHTNRTFRGDQTLKFWLDDRGVLIYEKGKGTVSPPCREDRDAILSWVEKTAFPMESR
jgi:hypothetical protein